MAISEVSVKDATLLAIEEINAAGGVLGKKIEPVDRGRRLRLADLRREGEEADPAGRGRRRLRLLDQRQPQGRAAGLREPERPALLPGPVRGPGGVAQHLLHRRRPPTSRSSRPSSTCWSRARRRSSCSAPTTSSRARPTRSSRRSSKAKGGDAGRRGVHAAGSHRLQHASSARSRRPSRTSIFNTLNGDSNVAFFKQFKDAGFTAGQAADAVGQRGRGRGARHRRRERRRPPGRLELLPDDRHAREREVRRRLQGEVRRQPRHRRPDRGRLLRRLPVEAGGREGRLDRCRRRSRRPPTASSSPRPRAWSRSTATNQHISKTVRIGKVRAGRPDRRGLEHRQAGRARSVPEDTTEYPWAASRAQAQVAASAGSLGDRTFGARADRRRRGQASLDEVPSQPAADQHAEGGSPMDVLSAAGCSTG